MLAALACGALAFAPPLHVARAPVSRSSRYCATPVAMAVQDRPGGENPDESEEARRKRLEALGREAASEAAYLDSAPASDDGLMAQFNARVDEEGGATMFKLKSGVNTVSESVSDGTQKAKAASEGAVDAAKGMFSGLTEQQRKIGTIGAQLAVEPSDTRRAPRHELR